MNETHFVVPLQGSPSDRYRHRHTLAGGTVGGFVIQYEAQIEGEWHEIVRYDTAHGSPHKDILHPDGTSTKEEFPHYTRAEVMTLGQTDIRKNWQKYRERCERELRRLK
jgi:hypothetical protein